MEKNYFIKEVKLPVKRIKKFYREDINDTDVLIDRYETGYRQIYLDDQIFVKTYMNPYAIAAKIGTSGIKLLEYIWDALCDNVTKYSDEEGYPQHHSIDKVKLDNKVLLDILNIDKVPAQRVRNKLIKLHIIAKADVKDYYWVNPYVMFVGDRSNKYKNDLDITPNNNVRGRKYSAIKCKHFK